MTLQIQSLSDTLRTTLQNTDFSNVETAAADAINQFDASVKTILGSSIGEVQGGVEAISQEIDDAQEALETNLVPTVSRVTSNVPNIASDLVGSVGPVSSDIQAITGTSAAAADGFIQDIVGASSPEAIQAGLSRATGRSTQELNAALQELTLPELRGVVSEAVDGVPYQNLQSQVNTFITQLNNAIQANSQFFLVDLGEKLEKNYENSVLSLVDRNLTTGDIADTFNLVANGDYDNAFETVRRYIDVPDNYDFITANFPRADWPSDVVDADDRINEAEAQFRVLSVELSSYGNPYSPGSNAAGTNSLPVSSVAGPGARNGTSSQGDAWNFDDITSLEELESMFRNVNRRAGQEISGAIIHWSATFLDQNVGSDWLHRSHLNRGFSGIGYHIVIRRDGTLQRGRPLNRSGAHDLNNNTNFLGFCFVGGVNEVASRAQRPYWRYASVESLTPAQFNAYDGLMRTFHNVFPYAQVQGHYATSNDGKIDPGFDVPGYSESKFGHVNVISENDSRWNSSTPITLAAIQAAGATV